MIKKLILTTFIWFFTSQIFAQQIPVGMCGIVYLYDANGARIYRTYFCNNGTDPYPTARAAEALLAASSNKNVENIEEKKTTITAMFENIEAIFPNPTTGRFSIIFSSNLVNAKVLIVDALGKVIYQTISNGSRIDLNITSFNSGMYFVRVEESGKVITQKIIKN